MRRAIGTMFVIPLFLSLGFGPLAVIALPVMLVVVAIVALPIFLILRKWGKLDWWHVVLAGGVCTLIAAWSYFGSGNPLYTDFAGPSNTARFLAIGLTGSAAYWWLGIFRNREFLFVSKGPPYSMILVLPLVLGLTYYHRIMIPTTGPTGCIEAQRSLADPTVWRFSEIEVRLSDNRVERFSLTQGGAQKDMIGKCAVTWQRPTATLTGTRYLYSGISEGQCGIDC